MELLAETTRIRGLHQFDIIAEAMRSLGQDIVDVTNPLDVYRMIQETNLLPKYVRHHCIDIVCNHHNS